MVGGAITRKLESSGFSNLLLKTSLELDLRNQQAVARFFCCRAAGICFSRRGKSRRYCR
ncbi:MAG: hypothetical protein PW786_04240 [Arachidicoccus sp.]|nr:hypothetical protein [Arachidicoccus sp.]